MKKDLSRRQLLKLASISMGSATLGCPSIIRTKRPTLPFGIQSGDISQNQAVIWAACDKAAQMYINWSTSIDMKNATRVKGPTVSQDSGLSGKQILQNLPAGKPIYYSVEFEDLNNYKNRSRTLHGTFKTAPDIAQNIRFLWSGDTAGQGWGINNEWGGMRIYQQMLSHAPDFFIHSGDCIYADGPFSETQQSGERIWKNDYLNERVMKVAETLDEFRANYQYNLSDKLLREFNQKVPTLFQWDDHEVVNNWYPTEILDDKRYREKSVKVLAQRARKAFLEWTPITPKSTIYRSFSYGPLLDIFMLDMRSYRGPNTHNTQKEPQPFLGNQQIQWLKKALKNSKATWKVIASDMPLGLIVPDGKNFENISNGPGAPAGRELEVAGLLKFILENNIQNIVWLTADVHYTAAHYYDPQKAQYKDFLPFWEFVSGPLNAGSFGANDLDNTFGPNVIFSKYPPKQNLAPWDGYQFYGDVQIDAKSQQLTVILRDIQGTELFQKILRPVI